MLKGHLKATSMRTKATVLEGIKLCCCQEKKNIKIELKSQQSWAAVLTLDLISMAQIADELRAAGF